MSEKEAFREFLTALIRVICCVTTIVAPFLFWSGYEKETILLFSLVLSFVLWETNGVQMRRLNKNK